MTVNGKLADVAAPAAARGRAGGPATVLAMGTATPANCLLQREYSDFYFNSTNSEHMSTELKNKFTRICEKSGVEKRYFHVTEELLKSNPTMQEFSGQSLDIRQEITVEEIPKLGGAAARKAIAEWGRPLSSITHLVFCSTGGMNLPGADWALTNLLGLRPDIRRTMLYSQGCFGGGTSLRMAKDLAENNKGARVLVVCAEMTVVLFRAPNEDYVDTLVGQALFSDGASALIVGSDPIPNVETPWFEVHWAGSYILPKSETAVTGQWKQIGLTFHLDKRVPQFVSENLPLLLKTAIDNIPDEHDKKQLGPNDIFWIAHPGGPAILAQIETSLDLKPHKFESTKKVLAEYGNMSSACVFFVMDQVRRNSLEKKLSTTGEGCKWGLLMSFGPGITCETLVLKSVPLDVDTTSTINI